MANPLITACKASGDDYYSYSVRFHPEDSGHAHCPACKHWILLRKDKKGLRRYIPWHLSASSGKGSRIVPKKQDN